MNGRVDDALRALLDVSVRRTPSEPPSPLTVWVDTACNGHFVLSQDKIDELGLQQHAATDAILADGSRVTLESYVCFVEWFGQWVPAQVIANDGRFPLLGTELLAERVLTVDYAERKLTVV